MIEQELQVYLKENYPLENEKCEWKEFKSLKHCVSGHGGEDIVSYISAIANMQGGHLLIGVADKSLKIVGIQEFHNYTAQNIILKILNECPNLSSEGFSVKEYKTSDTKKVVWVFHIPKHQYRLPVYAHKMCWQRIEDSLTKMTQARLDAILTEVRKSEDWSAQVVEGATIEDLDPDALKKARIEFVKRNPKYEAEEPAWDDTKFLNKAVLSIKGRITRTALILLGKEESGHFLGSSVKIRWILKTVNNQDKDFEVFSIPFILAVDQVYGKIRNLKYRYLREGTLFPNEVLRYDPFTIREPLNNAIAHQDYNLHGYINVVEFEDDKLVYSNMGSFLPKSVEQVVLQDTPQETYRNPFLVAAMKNLDMIETQGGGIRKVFNFQRERFFPLPDFDLTNDKCKVSVVGKILNEEFARILVRNPALSLEEIILLDKVQKRNQIGRHEYQHLKKLKLIEGRYPNCYLSLKVVQPVNDDDLKAQYIRNRSFDDEHFRGLIIEYLQKYSVGSRKSIETLLLPKLSDALTDVQKIRKVGNLLFSLRKAGKIQVDPDRNWILI